MSPPAHSFQTVLEQLLTRLRNEGRQLPKTLPRAWFSDELFHCRSEYSADYLREIEENARTLDKLSPQASSYGYLSQRVEAQLLAYTQAILRARKPAANSRSATARSGQSTKQDSARKTLSTLHQDLAEHHEYERRLQDNLREAQQKAVTGTGKHDVIIKCQQRLLRCQRAIAAIEKKIESN
ncbi:primosomal replication protein PriC [Aliidiomarina soli]|uniref:Primosomal replication protein N n=1 Tax=Aliidiomarina soli TaxID=1928574 RepID=A0A432WGU8_9GAMM|nr:primosomal replication protein PriC [Aliidiomarina soli]RUO32994.1 hypothetical protein CWE14_07050 [Aliidiomarina soli]